MLKIRKSVHTGRRLVILGIVLAIMLFAGVRPWGYTFHNTASLQAHPPGLSFGAHGLAFTRPFVTEADVLEVNRHGLTLDLEVDMAGKPPDGFAAIAVLHNGDNASQWYLGQWQHHLVLLNGDDYDHKRRLPRISADTAKFPSGRLHLRITSDSAGSTFSVNGERIDHRPDFIQTVPVRGRLTLGNAPDGKHPWNGTLHHFALYRKSLGPDQPGSLTNPAPPNGSAPAGQPATPWLFYQFDSETATAVDRRQVPDQSGNAINLEFPLATAFLTREFLGPGTVAPFTAEITSKDGILNFFGFIPLGWIVARLIGSRTIRPGTFTVMAMTTGAGFALSFGIEFLQTWMPTRSSSLLDLVLNTVGTLAGAILACGLARRGRL
ncbi:MAG: VanZ family protein [Opitutaceae bacterium]